MNSVYFPKVSVVITGKNCSRTILDTLDSVNAQTYGNIEVVYEDAASIDGTQELVLDYIEKKGLKDKYVFNSQIDHSLCEGRNIGLRFATGEYVVIFDADDIMLPHRIEKQVQSLCEGVNTSSVAGVRYSEGNEIHIPPMDKAPVMVKFLRRKNRLIGGIQYWMFRKDILDQIGGFNEDIKCFEDTEMVFRYLQVDDRVGFVPEALSIWNNSDDPNRLTNQNDVVMSPNYIYASKHAYVDRLNYLIDNPNLKLLFINLNFIVSYERKFMSEKYAKERNEIFQEFEQVLSRNKSYLLLYRIIRRLRFTINL